MNRFINIDMIEKCKKSILPSTLVFILALAYLSIPRWDYLGDFITDDDTIFLPKALLGVETFPGFNFYRVIDALGIFQSIFVIKCFPLVLIAANITLIFLIVKRFIPSLLLSALIGFIVGGNSIAIDQIIFVTGSHPTYALFFELLALYIFTKSIADFKNVSYSLFFLTAIPLLMAGWFASSAAGLALCAMPAWILFLKFSEEKSKLRWPSFLLVFSASFLPAVFFYLFLFKMNHYAGIQGWTEISAANILTNLTKSLGAVFLVKHSANQIIWMIIYSLVALTLFVLVIHRFNAKNNLIEINAGNPFINRKSLSVGFASLTMAALSFGPASITTALLDRYLVISFSLSLLFLFLFLVAHGFFKLTNTQNKLLTICLLLIILVNGYLVFEKTHATYLRRLSLQNVLSQNFEDASKKWPENSQVVVLWSKGDFVTPTVGFNHWSTWYLKFISGRNDIIGLVGPQSSISRLPFVSQYKDHDPEYWELIGERSSRIRMKGLEKDRPTFVYQIDEKGNFSLYDGVVFMLEKLVFIKAGKSLLEAEPYSPANQRRNTFIWPYPKYDPSTTKNESGANQNAPKPKTAHFEKQSDTNYLYRHDPEAKQRLWIHSIERSTEPGETLKASLKLTSNIKMSLSASLARHDTNEPYEGTARSIVLEPGVETLIEVAHTFLQPRKNLKIQLDIKECDGETAEITIRDIQVSKTE